MTDLDPATGLGFVTAVESIIADLTGIDDAGLDRGRHHPSGLGRATAGYLQPVRLPDAPPQRS